jgi:gamma-glutamylputrescine oxidase
VTAPLDRDLSVDAVVVGGGVAGLTCAWFLREGGLSVALLEKTFCGGGASGKSSGFITPASELELTDVVATFGIERAPGLWGFAESGVELIRSSIHDLGIACDYQVQDSLFLALDSRGGRHAAAEHRARVKLGFPSTYYPREELRTVVATTAFAAGVRFPGTFGIDSYRYCRGLRNALVERGVRVYEGTPVTDVRPGTVQAAGRTVTAGHVLLCTDRWTPGLLRDRPPIGQVQTFLAISAPLRDEQVRRIFPGAPVMAWDSRLTYDYFRLTGEQRLLVGGANLWHTYALRERNDPARNIAPVSAFVARTFPGLDVRFEHVWPGMLGVSKDFLPVAETLARHPTLAYVAAAAGLPWAAALGRRLGQSTASGIEEPFADFSARRRALADGVADRVLTTRGGLALAHGVLAARALASGS